MKKPTILYTILVLIFSFIIFLQSCNKSSEPRSEAAYIFEPLGMAIDNIGNIYIANSSPSVIKLSPNGTYVAIVDTNSWLGCGGDGQLAISEMVQNPYGVCLDQNGNIYFSDCSCNKIHKINSSGVLIAVAGNGSIGYGGDGGSATGAGLQSPCGIAIDKAGSIYIADNLNNRVRKVDGSTGIITTVVGNGSSGKSGDGGPATACQLSPYNLSLDDSMNIYIIDRTNFLIRKVNASTGIINTIAGNGQSPFNGDSISALSAAINPEAIALDSIGNIYISDGTNNRIRKMNIKNRMITTIAGNGVSGFSGDNGPATNAELSGPWGIVIDKTGNLYFADSQNSRIRKIVLSTGIITTVAH